MIEIDGSYGEGGGQILRTAAALSVLLNKEVSIKRIRVKRPNPGLRPQHLTALNILKELSNAETKGLSVGSLNVYFSPKNFVGGEYVFDVGTAGSVTLVFQTVLLASLRSSEPFSLKVKGGTDVKWSPTWDYFTRVFLPLVKRLGVNVEVELNRRGFYPKGGGEVRMTVSPAEMFSPFRADEPQRYSRVKGTVAISRLPDHISDRVKHTLMRFFISKSMDAEFFVDRDDKSLSEGVVVTLWSESQETVVGSTMLGERGLPAERLAKGCAESLMKEVEAKVSLDVHATDQLLPYIAFVASEQQETSIFLTRELSGHTQTNMWLLEKFLPVRFEAKDFGGCKRVEVKPV
ncbi:MAG: RNA 3'-terminal phosphate cyclase [Thermoplasmata archaeon]|nr:MAG: RNA 3'-terminal phosphate cyclase [Thermoplasmata archaeon]RLF26118.1 MAG: RNA 3'-terminal phosphate cyclase [Thermoplasmata archaeon]